MPRRYATVVIYLKNRRLFINEWYLYGFSFVFFFWVGFLLTVSLVTLISKVSKAKKDVNKNPQNNLRGGRIKKLTIEERLKLEKILICLEEADSDTVFAILNSKSNSLVIKILENVLPKKTNLNLLKYGAYKILNLFTGIYTERMTIKVTRALLRRIIRINLQDGISIQHSAFHYMGLLMSISVFDSPIVIVKLVMSILMALSVGTLVGFAWLGLMPVLFGLLGSSVPVLCSIIMAIGFQTEVLAGSCHDHLLPLINLPTTETIHKPVVLLPSETVVFKKRIHSDRIIITPDATEIAIYQESKNSNYDPIVIPLSDSIMITSKFEKISNQGITVTAADVNQIVDNLDQKTAQKNLPAKTGLFAEAKRTSARRPPRPPRTSNYTQFLERLKGKEFKERQTNLNDFILKLQQRKAKGIKNYTSDDIRILMEILEANNTNASAVEKIISEMEKN